MELFDFAQLEGPEADRLAERYRLAEPFPHAVLKDFVTAPAEEVVSAFPDPAWDGWIDRTGTGPYQPGKSSCRDIALIPPFLREMIDELSQPRFLGALSKLTGIPNLLPDPFLHGGGLQFSLPGGKLTPHTDFHNHPHLKLFRRVNILVYLNPNWKQGDGGEVNLFNLGVDRPVVAVGPSYGTCVIFSTDHRSVHGVTPISQNAEARRSIALYYYTIEPAEVFSGDGQNYWYEPTPETGQRLSQRARVTVMRATLELSKAFMRMSYRLDPQHPIRLRGSDSAPGHEADAKT